MRQLPAAMFALLVATGAALGQEAATLSDLKACRLNAELIALSFSYEGGACEQTGDPGVEVGDAGTAVVKVPVVTTSDVCTMQAKQVQSESAVAVPEEITAIDVQLVSPAGEVKAAGKTDIAPTTPECVPPKEADQATH